MRCRPAGDADDEHASLRPSRSREGGDRVERGTVAAPAVVSSTLRAFIWAMTPIPRRIDGLTEDGARARRSRCQRAWLRQVRSGWLSSLSR